MVGSDSMSFSFAVKKYGSDKEQSYNNDGRWRIIKSFSVIQCEGEIQYKIIQLQSRTNPHTANLLQDYSKIQAAASDKKKNEFVNEWVNQTIKNTFIEIKSDYATCPEVQKWVSK
ncbi:unnamed protein product [Bathycoccus prasinos]